MAFDVSKILSAARVKVQCCPCLEQRPTVYGLGVCRLCLDAWWERAPDLPIEERLGDGPIPHRVLKPTAPKPPGFQVPTQYRAHYHTYDADDRCERCGTTRAERMAKAARDGVGVRSRT